MSRHAVSNPAAFFLLSLGILVLGTMESAQAQLSTSEASGFQAQIDCVFKRNCPAVVRVRACDDLGVRFGSGFFIDPVGTIYTHSAVVTKAHEVRVIFNGRSLVATVLAADERSGIAMLKTDCISPFLSIGNSLSVKQGTPVISIGYPEDFDATPCLGMIAARDKHHMGRFFSTSHLRANLAVHRGQGGSPVLGLDGRVVGIVISQLGGGASCFILPIEAAEKVRQDIFRFGEIRPGWVGAEVEDDIEPIRGSTARISRLVSADPGESPSLGVGDIILSIGGRPVATCEDILDASYFLTAGEPTQIEVVRDGNSITLSVMPKLHPSANSNLLHADHTQPGAPTLD
jgi:S1-C subfamily serine protease